MRFRSYVLGLFAVVAVAVGGVAVASPAWAADPATGKATCRLEARVPKVRGSTLSGSGLRSGCSDTVTYFWVRVYKVIDYWPDAEKAVTGIQYVQNGQFTAAGPCDGHGSHYTHVSTATGMSGDDVESGRVELC